MNGDPIIAYVLFTDGATRAVYLEAGCKQYVLDDWGEKVHGVWYLPPAERIGPNAVVDSDPF
jgi:hypothetical protein